MNRNGVIWNTPWNPPPSPSLRSLQLLLSSQQQLLCSCCYALCNERFCVCSPLADVMHSGDGVLCLCHLEVSRSSMSGMSEIHHCIVYTFNRNVLISTTCDAFAVKAPNLCEHKEDKHAQYTTKSQTCRTLFGYKWTGWIPLGKNIVEWLIDWQCWNEFPVLDYHPFFIHCS